MKITKIELQGMVNQLVKIEIESVNDALKQSKKDSLPEYFKQHSMMAQSYLKGLERAIEIISTVMSEVKDD